MPTDAELLREFAVTGSEDAFAELVRQHVDLVHSAALRQVNGDEHLARDVAQSVFADLARKAGSLSGRAVLTGWLYTSTHFAAAKAVRAEQRRRAREKEAFLMRELPDEHESEPNWSQLRPELDAAMQQLAEKDREVILLRFFENRPLGEIGLRLGLTENAARMRVERALDKLKGHLARRGVVTTAGALSLVISSNAVQVAPAGLSAILASTSLIAGTGTGAGLNLFQLMNAANLKLGIAVLATAGALTLAVVEHKSFAEARNRNAFLQADLAQAMADKETLTRQNASVGASRQPSADASLELLRLRAEVTRLGNQLSQATNALSAVHSNSVVASTSEAEQQRLRAYKMTMAKNLAYGTLYEYPDRHGGRMPTNMNQLKAVFDWAERISLNPGDPMPDTDADFQQMTNEFEFVYYGPVTNLYQATNFGEILVLRSTQPMQMPDGRAAKIYGFADGHSQQMAEPPEGFQAWEAKHLFQPSSN